MQLSLRLAWMKNLKITTFTNQYVRRSHREYIQGSLNIYIGPQFGILTYYIFFHLKSMLSFDTTHQLISPIA